MRTIWVLLSFYWRHGRFNKRRGSVPVLPDATSQAAELAILKTKYAEDELDIEQVELLTGRVLLGESAADARDRQRFIRESLQ